MLSAYRKDLLQDISSSTFEQAENLSLDSGNAKNMIRLSWVKKMFAEIVVFQSEPIISDIDLDDEICYSDIDFDDDIYYDLDDEYKKRDRLPKRKIKTTSQHF